MATTACVVFGASACGGTARPVEPVAHVAARPHAAAPPAPVLALFLEDAEDPATQRSTTLQSLWQLDSRGALATKTALFLDSERSIGGYSLSADGRWLTVVQVGGFSYGGAIVPLYLKEVWLTVVDTRDGSKKSVGVLPACSFQSIAVTWQAPDRVHVRLKDVGNGSSDQRVSFTCTMDDAVCAPGIAATPPKGGLAPTIEVTAAAGYRLPSQPEAIAGPAARDGRSVRRSPNGAWLAYVHRPLDEHGDERAVERTEIRDEYRSNGRSTLAGWRPVRELWIRSDTQQRRIHVGEGEIHPEWLDEDTLVFEADEESPPDERDATVGGVRHLLTYRLSTGAIARLPHANARLGATFERVRVVSQGRIVQVAPDEGPPEEPLRCGPPPPMNDQ